MLVADPAELAHPTQGSRSVHAEARRTVRRIGCALLAAASVLAAGTAGATLTVTPITWNVVGLDSNSPASGPRHFPVGARVCSTTPTTNVAVNWMPASSR